MIDQHKARSILGRQAAFFGQDVDSVSVLLSERIRESSFLVLGGAGSIGQAVVKTLLARKPRRLHVVDISENSLVELVRDIRSSIGHTTGRFRALPIDIAGPEFASFLQSVEPYEYVLNLSALKHVRSEKDRFSLMRMISVNVLNTEATLRAAAMNGCPRYFAVSSDKAANPANAMGASKRAMEKCLIRASETIEVSSARFANVAFSDGSLLSGFSHRLSKRQPLAAPSDVQRYFITAEEAGILCVMSCLLAANREVYFPKVSAEFTPVGFRCLAERFLESHGLRAHPCETEDEARSRVEELAAQGAWPCYFSASDTTGEKPLEEFWTEREEVDLERYRHIGVLTWPLKPDQADLDTFISAIHELCDSGRWTRKQLLDQLKLLVPEFRHLETGRFLDSRM